MKRHRRLAGPAVSGVALAMCLSCSPPGTPVQENVLVGRWQQVGKPAVVITFQKDRTFSADVAGKRLLGGRYYLLAGGQLVLDCDASSPKAGPVTNSASMVGQELRIKTADGPIEEYKRVE